MPDSLRLFIGIDVGEDWSRRLSDTADRLRESLGRSVRWVRPELYHVTVVFLGNHPPGATEAIGEALARTTERFEPFPLRLTELRRLGRHEAGAIVAGVDDVTGQLQRFRAHLDDQLRMRDIVFDAKRLVPHVTLGRPRGRAGQLRIGAMTLHDTPPLTVRSANLVKSDLLPTGPRYHVLATCRLGEG